MNYSKFLILFMLLFSSCQSDVAQKYTYQKDIMYTVFDVVVYSKLPQHQITSKIDQIWTCLQYLEKELSPAGDGYLGQLNKQGHITKTQNPKMFDILSNFIDVSKDIHQQSDGAFDLTVYPLIRLWGFYLQDEKYTVPTPQDIQSTLQNVGMEHIYLTENEIILSNQVRLDIGAIAKGYAVDVAIDILQECSDISAGFVNAGGNIRVYGTKPDNTAWKVGIRNPNGGDIQEVISLYDGDSIATSGDYEQYFELDGKRYHHIFNPKTGYPVDHHLASVSVVVKKNAEYSDILATTFLSLGKQKSLNSTLNQDISLFFIEREGEDLISSANELWLQRR